MGCDLYIDRRVMPRHRRHRGSSLEQRPSKRASVPGPKNGPCFRRIVRFPRPMKEITTSRPFARLSILRCFPLQTRILVGVSISGSCAFLPAVRSVSSFFLSFFLPPLAITLRSSPLLSAPLTPSCHFLFLPLLHADSHSTSRLPSVYLHTAGSLA